MPRRIKNTIVTMEEESIKTINENFDYVYSVLKERNKGKPRIIKNRIVNFTPQGIKQINDNFDFINETLTTIRGKNIMILDTSASSLTMLNYNFDFVYEVIDVKKLLNDFIVAFGENHLLILLENGDLGGCDDTSYGEWDQFREYGQLGLPMSERYDVTNYMNYAVPATPRIITKGVKAISCGYYHSAMIKNDDSLWTFGNNMNQELGTPRILDSDGWSLNPVPIKIMENIKFVACSHNATYIVKMDNTMWSVGEISFREYPQYALGSYIPEQVMSDVRFISTEYTTCVIKTDNSLWTFGKNSMGQLGHTIGLNQFGTNGYLIVAPTQVMTNVNIVSSTDGHSAAIKNDGTLWLFGNEGSYGVMGYINPPPPYRPSAKLPFQMMANVRFVKVFITHVVVIKTDNSLWTWGANYYGQLGHTDNVGEDLGYNANLPRQVATDVESVIATKFSTRVTKLDGTVIVFGELYYLAENWSSIGFGMKI